MAESNSKLSFVDTQHPSYDEIRLNSTIPNFKALYNITKSKKDLIIMEEKFRIGGHDWAFHLSQHNREDVGVYMYFYGTQCISAEYTVFLKPSNGEEFTQTIRLGPYQYKPQGSIFDGSNDAWGWQKWKTLTELQKEGYLKDDTLNLKVIVRVYSPKQELKLKASQDFRNGLDSGIGADVTFIFVEDEGSENVIGEVKTHRAILSLRSSVFATMFASGMTEATDGKVRISDMTPKAFRVLLQYIYSGEVDSEWGFVIEELFYGVNKYHLEDLQKYLCANVDSVLTVENVMRIRDLATLYNFPDVSNSTSRFISENMQKFFENHQVIFKNS